MSIADSFISWKQRKEYESNFKKSRDESIMMHLLSDTFDKNVSRTKHPFHDIRLSDYKKEISMWNKKEVSINFGDSLTDMSRNQLSRVHDGIFSISGSWAHHIEMMAVDLKDSLKDFEVRNISVGCLGGNPLLCYQNYSEVVNDSKSALNTIRKLYPNAKITVYGLPPVFSIYVSENTYQFDSILFNWCINDKKASFISLKDHFGRGFGRLFPSTKWSSDGVHFNPNGASKFATLINGRFNSK
jgi:hypothetical protein